MNLKTSPYPGMKLWEFWLAVFLKYLIIAMNSASQHRENEVFVTTLTKMNAWRIAALSRFAEVQHFRILRAIYYGW